MTNVILNKYFGYAKLKDKQEDIIKNILNKKDTIGILATGYGKSICYQMPFLINNEKNVLVISPLISLMEDQKTKLEELNISVYCLNSTNLNKNYDKDRIINGHCGIIYMSPEYFFSSIDFIKKLIKNDELSLIAIDESHCVSTWSDFRPEYKNLGIIKDIAKENIPILALTATATPKIINEIRDSLKLDNPEIIKSSFYRSNLNININRKSKFDLDIKEIVNLIKEVDSKDKIIIYCKTKDETEQFVDKLRLYDLKIKSYHAGKSGDLRKKIQNKFMKGEINIIAATIAFGMGVDLPNIRLIINYGISKDMESFYQEIGRAGRDGNESNIYVYWSDKDFFVNKSFLNDIEDQKFKYVQLQRILEIEKFVKDKGCRMKYITNYFGEDIPNCGHCDNCKSDRKEEQIDITNESYYIIKLVKKMNINYGSSMICDILYGANSKKMNDQIKKNKMYGILKHFTKDKIKERIRFLILNNFLEEVKLQNAFGSVIKLPKKGLEWIKKNKNLDVINDDEKIFDTQLIDNVEYNDDLEDKLKKYRREKSINNKVKPYDIFPNKTIEILLKVRVKTINDLTKIDGLGAKRIEKYGEDILDILNKNPLKVTKVQNGIDKLINLGLSIDEINSIKEDFIKDI